MILTFNFRTIHAGVRVNFTGTNIQNQKGVQNPKASTQLTQFSVFKKKLQYRRSKMQNDTLNRNYKVVPKP